MDIHDQGLRAVPLMLGALAGVYVLLKLVIWAKKGGKGAILAGALFGLGFVADPIFERILRTVQQAREHEEEEDASGDPPNS